MVSKCVVYTAIYGDYDQLKPHASVSGTDFICFTDDHSLRRQDWNIVYDPPRFSHPRMAAKFHKLIGHDAIREYDQSIWIDGTLELRDGAFIDAARAYLGRSGWAIFKHPYRTNIFDEAELSIPMEKYRKLPIQEQVEHYRKQGFRSDNGLYWCGVHVRNLHDPVVARFGPMWMQENVDWTYQDQLSFPYLLWKLDFTPALLPDSLRGMLAWSPSQKEEGRRSPSPWRHPRKWLREITSWRSLQR